MHTVGDIRVKVTGVTDGTWSGRGEGEGMVMLGNSCGQNSTMCKSPVFCNSLTL